MYIWVLADPLSTVHGKLLSVESYGVSQKCVTADQARVSWASSNMAKCAGQLTVVEDVRAGAVVCAIVHERDGSLAGVDEVLKSRPRRIGDGGGCRCVGVGVHSCGCVGRSPLRDGAGKGQIHSQRDKPTRHGKGRLANCPS